MALILGALDPQGIQRPAARALDAQFLENAHCKFAIAAGTPHLLHSILHLDGIR
mgnify:CR=1